MRNPVFSVIIPTLNEEKFLPNLLTSLSEQSKKNFEVIVVDGHSKDKTVAAARRFTKKLPSLSVDIVKKPSLPAQRNRGASLARGEWLVFVDADSVLMPYFIERIERFIAERAPLVFTTWTTPDSNTEKDAMFTLFANIFLESALLLRRIFPTGPLSCIHRDVFTKIGGYDDRHEYHEDVDLGLRLQKAGIPFSLLREVLYVWSLRRYRREGTLKVLQQYVVSFLPVIFFRRTFKFMPGYVMGGHMYGKQKPNRSVLTTYEKKLTRLMRELFG